MNWTRGQIIGRGSTATVSVATSVCLSGRHDAFAVKSAELSKSEFLKNEQSILSKLSPCPQIVSYEGFDVTQENGKSFYNIFLEYSPAGSLTDEIRRHGGRLEEGIIRLYAREILLGLHHLHSNGIVHSDIKCHNILVTSDGPKIADFGCARRINQISGGCSIAGTPIYMAPEVARGEHQGFSGDVWALGCTIIEMATGQTSWAKFSDPVSVLYKIGCSGDCLPEIPSFMSKQGQDFLSKCLKRNPLERWSASELLNHGYITEQQQVSSASSSVLKGINVNTPTSVLEQQELWETSCKENSLSPMERIGKLAQDNVKIPNWVLDKNWITVRGKEAEAKLASFDSQDFGFVDENNNSFSLGTNYDVSGEYASINLSLDEVITSIRELIIFNTRSRGTTIHKILLPMDCTCTNDDDNENFILTTWEFHFHFLALLSFSIVSSVKFYLLFPPSQNYNHFYLGL